MEIQLRRLVILPLLHHGFCHHGQGCLSHWWRPCCLFIWETTITSLTLVKLHHFFEGCKFSVMSVQPILSCNILISCHVSSLHHSQSQMIESSLPLSIFIQDSGWRHGTMDLLIVNNTTSSVSEKQCTPLCSLKKRTLLTFVVWKAETTNFCNLKKWTLLTIVVRKSRHYKSV